MLSFILSLSLAIPLVLAAGGGGGGGGGAGSSSVSRYSDIKCTDTGVLSFTRGTEWDEVIVQDPNGDEIIISGSWKNGKFTSEEASMVKAGKHVVKDLKYGNKEVTCPGLAFSCTLMSLQLQECQQIGGKVKVHFVLEGVGTSPEDLEYQFKQQDSSRLFKRSKTSISSELKNFQIIKASSSSFSLETELLPAVETVQISHPRCIGQYYTYSKITCSKEEKVFAAIEENGQKLKCGGYLDIADRVKCRLRLREEQADEYENFFPEECKARKDSVGQEQCLQVYKAVQECWDFPNGSSRIACVKRQLKLGEVLAERANCNVLDAGKRENCNQELRDKAYGLIKFRLYNLEEEAEELMEEGRLSEDDVTVFVVKMEGSKLAFNKATSKEERRAIILGARKAWIELMKKVDSEA